MDHESDRRVTPSDAAASPVAPVIDRKAVHSALKAWHYPQKLGTHALARLRLVAAQRIASPHPDTPIGHGLALREVLRATIETLKPDGDTSDLSDPAWRHYLLLERRYVLGRPVTEVAEGLGMAYSTFQHEQAPAMDLLAHALQVRERACGPVALAEPEPATPTVLAARPRHNLPAPLSSFIGREKQFAQLWHWLTPDGGASAERRLVTLVGAGGIGKSRLSIEAARACLPGFAHGVWLAELAPLSNAELLADTVATALAVPRIGQCPALDALCAFLREKTLLLVLDNCEHLLDACASLAEHLLCECPQLRILATSREALNLAGETTLRVPSLDVPAAESSDLAALAECEAVRLFVDRAAAARLEFEVTQANGPHVAQICRRLDGIPLAIELAAARVRALSVEQIAARLDDRFHLLTGGSRTALPRHQTLRATIDWSYDLLSEPERTLFRRLAVFMGGWALEAAEGVCAGDGLDQADILDLLTRLVDKSLVNAREHVGETRFGRLETVRQYAQEKLSESGEGERLQRRHLEYYLRFAEHADREMYGPRSLEWTRRMDVEEANLSVALETALGACEESDAGLQLINALHGFGGWGGYWTKHGSPQTFYWMQRASEQCRGWRGTPLWARFQLRYGIMLRMRGKWQVARPALEESLELFRTLGEPYRIDRAWVQIALGLWLHGDGESETGDRYMQEAANIFEDSGHKWGLGWALNFLSGVSYYFDEDLQTACARAREGLDLYKEMGDAWGIAVLLHNLGEWSVRRGDYAEGRRYLEEALVTFRDFGSIGFLWQVLRLLGDAARGLHEYEKAEPLYLESLSLVRERRAFPDGFIGLHLDLCYAVLHQGRVGQAVSFILQGLESIRSGTSQMSPACCLDCLAAVLAVQGKAESAARVYGALETRIQWLLAQGDKLSIILTANDRMEIDHYRSICHAGLGEAAFQTLLAEGRALTVDEAIELALREIG